MEAGGDGDDGEDFLSPLFSRERVVVWSTKVSEKVCEKVCEEQIEKALHRLHPHHPDTRITGKTLKNSSAHN
jgi:hypothetical protein